MYENTAQVRMHAIYGQCFT